MTLQEKIAGLKAVHIWRDQTLAQWQTCPISSSVSPANRNSLKEHQDLYISMPSGPPRLPLCSPLHTARMSHQAHTAGPNQPPPAASMNQQPLNVPYDGMAQPPFIPGMHHPLPQPQSALMSVTDMREQILANALVLFTHIVSSHSRRFPNIPPRAQDVFEVSISLQHTDSGPDFIARLTHRYSLAPALHVLVLGGVPQTSAEGALWHLLDTTCTMLGTEQANVIERPHSGRAPTPTLRGTSEGDRALEMGLAKACVTQLRKTALVHVDTNASMARTEAR